MTIYNKSKYIDFRFSDNILSDFLYILYISYILQTESRKQEAKRYKIKITILDIII